MAASGCLSSLTLSLRGGCHFLRPLRSKKWPCSKVPSPEVGWWRCLGMSMIKLKATGLRAFGLNRNWDVKEPSDQSPCLWQGRERAWMGPHQTLPHLIFTHRMRWAQSFVVWGKLRCSYARISLFHRAEKCCAMFSVALIPSSFMSSSHHVCIPPLPPAPLVRITPPWCVRSASLDGPIQPIATALIWRMYCHNLVQNI